MVRFTLILLASLALAGCQTTPDDGWTENWTVRIVSEEPLLLQIPVWAGVAEDLRVVEGDATLYTTSCDDACIVIVALPPHETVVLQAHRTGCCDDAFLERSWPSMFIARDDDSVPSMRITEHIGTMSMDVRVDGAGCWREAHFESDEEGSPWMPGYDHGCHGRIGP